MTSAPRRRGSDWVNVRRLVVASFVMLFAELALIRWVSAYQVHVAYFTNFVLLASFLGIGVGFLRASSAKGRGFRVGAVAFAGFTGARCSSCCAS